jgi:hypothetical protein
MVGENCREGGAQAWLRDGEGYCLLCLYIQWQSLMDVIYAADPQKQYETRSQDPNAVLFPKCDEDGISWYVCYDGRDVAEATMSLVGKANYLRPCKKDPNLFTGHSNKVGGTHEAIHRGCSLPEMQDFTAHVSPQVLLGYAAKMGRFGVGQMLSEMQSPPLELTHDLFTTRGLYTRILELGKLVKQLLVEKEQLQATSDRYQVMLDSAACREGRYIQMLQEAAKREEILIELLATARLPAI